MLGLLVLIVVSALAFHHVQAEISLEDDGFELNEIFELTRNTVSWWKALSLFRDWWIGDFIISS